MSPSGFTLLLLFGGGLGFVSGLADGWGISRIAGPAASFGGALLLQGALLLLTFRLHTVSHPRLRQRVWVTWLLLAALSVFFSFAGMDARWNQRHLRQLAPVLETEAVRQQAVTLQQAMHRNRARALAHLSRESAALQEEVNDIDAQFRYRRAGRRTHQAVERDLLRSRLAFLQARERQWEALDLDIARVLAQPSTSRRYRSLTIAYGRLSRLWAVAPPGIGTPALPPPPIPPPSGVEELKTGANDDLAGPLLRLLHPRGVQWLWLVIAVLLESASLLLLCCGAFDPRAAERIYAPRVSGDKAAVGWPELAEYQERCRARLQLARDAGEWARRDEENRIADGPMDLALEVS